MITENLNECGMEKTKKFMIVKTKKSFHFQNK